MLSRGNGGLITKRRFSKADVGTQPSASTPAFPHLFLRSQPTMTKPSLAPKDPSTLITPKKGPAVSLSPTWRRHTCIDRVVPDEHAPARAIAHSVALSQAKALMSSKPLGQLDPASVIKAKMAVVNAKKWMDGQSVRCRFLDGSAMQRKRVEEQAHMWESYANVQLVFGDSPDAEVRISFQADPGSWSGIGTDCLVASYFPKHQPTMNFGWLEDGTSEDEYRRVVVHEFGHALGCIHEHQSPKEHLHWNVEAVYAAFSGPPNYWSKEDIDANILEKYSPKGISATAFDVHSIMLYEFDSSLFTNHKGTPLNTDLSDHDKQFIKAMYP